MLLKIHIYVKAKAAFWKNKRWYIIRSLTLLLNNNNVSKIFLQILYFIFQTLGWQFILGETKLIFLEKKKKKYQS